MREVFEVSRSSAVLASRFHAKSPIRGRGIGLMFPARAARLLRVRQGIGSLWLGQPEYWEKVVDLIAVSLLSDARRYLLGR